MTWHVKYHSEELRNRSIGFGKVHKKFRAAQRLLMPRRIDIKGPTGWKAVACKNARSRPSHLHVKVTCHRCHPWDPVVEGLLVPQMLRR